MHTSSECFHFHTFRPACACQHFVQIATEVCCGASAEPTCRLNFAHFVSPSDPFDGGVQQEFVSATGGAGGYPTGVPGGGGTHLYPVLRGVEALRRLLRRRDAAVYANSHP